MNLQSQLLFGGLIFLLGLAAGFLVFWLTKDDDKKPEQPVEHPHNTPAHPPVSGAVKIGTIWQEESSRILVQALDGSLLEGAAAQELLQPIHKRPGQPDQPTRIADMPAEAQILPPRPVDQSLEGIVQPNASRPVEPVNMNAMDTISRAFQKPKPPAPRSLAVQINDILQEGITGSELARRGLCLVDLPDHELGVLLDLHTYHGIDQVPDPAATQAIRAAVMEWQSRNK
jgi:hypothetical protein